MWRYSCECCVRFLVIALGLVFVGLLVLFPFVVLGFVAQISRKTSGLLPKSPLVLRKTCLVFRERFQCLLSMSRMRTKKTGAKPAKMVSDATLGEKYESEVVR